MKVAPAPAIRSVSDHFQKEFTCDINQFETIDLDGSPPKDGTFSVCYHDSLDETLVTPRSTVNQIQSETDGESEKKRAPLRARDSYCCAILFVTIAPLILLMSSAILHSVCRKLMHEHNSKLPSVCLIKEVEEINYTSFCNCGKCTGRNIWTCLSTYPCYSIEVDYASDNLAYTGTGNLIGHNISTPCSVDLPEPCYDRDFMNEKLVDEEITWLTGQSQGIGCVLDLDNPSSLPIGKNYKLTSSAEVAQCYFWPGSLIFVVLVWLVYVAYDLILTIKATKRYKRWRNIQPDGYVTPPSQEEIIRMSIELRNSQNDMTRWQRIKRFLNSQIMDKETILGKKRMLFIESMKNRPKDIQYGTQSKPKPDTYLAGSSHLVTVIGRDTEKKDAEGTKYKEQLENMKKFLRMEDIPITESDQEED